MRITQEDDYALRVMLYLFEYGRGLRVEAKEVAEHENIPLRFLLKLLRKLVAAGLVRSYRGTGGGYALAREPAETSLREVIEAVEGPIYVNRCLQDPQLCNLKRADTCDIHKALEAIQQKLVQELESMTFDRIIKLDKAV